MKQAISILKEIKNGSREDKLFYLAYLKEVGKLGKRIYKLCPDEWLKKSLIELSNYIQQYAKNIK